MLRAGVALSPPTEAGAHGCEDAPVDQPIIDRGVMRLQ